MDLFITQNTYYFVHRHFIKFFENKNSEIIYVIEKKRGIKRKYLELINTFGIYKTLYLVFMELVFMFILYNKQKNLKAKFVYDYVLNDLLEKVIIEKKITRIISIGCPCLIDSNLQKRFGIKIFNLHGGIIPFQQGRFSPINALRNKQKFLGASIHLISDTFDNGLIISQDYFIAKNKNLISNYNKVLSKSSQLLELFLKGINKSIPKEILDLL